LITNLVTGATCTRSSLRPRDVARHSWGARFDDKGGTGEQIHPPVVFRKKRMSNEGKGGTKAVKILQLRPKAQLARGGMAMADRVGTVAALWRFPVKSMLGEKLDATEVSGSGLAGDHAYALIDATTGKVVSAKNPRLWPNMLGCRARFLEPPRTGEDPPPVRITLPDGTSVTSDASDTDSVLSASSDARCDSRGPPRRISPSISTIPTSRDWIRPGPATPWSRHGSDRRSSRRRSSPRRSRGFLLRSVPAFRTNYLYP
jgi:hypothetical protein